MADLSKITLPNGTTYDLKDTTARNGNPSPATATPSAIGTAAVGSSAKYAREDHVHNIALATGDSNGQVKIAGTNVSVKGLSTLAYQSNLAPSQVVTGNDGTASGLDAVTMPLIGSAASNKSFGLPAEAITIEYSTNGGSSWSDYGATDNQKRDLFNETRTTSFYLGKASAKASNTVNNRLRITIEPTDRYVSFHGIYCWFSTNSNTCVMDLERSTIGAKDTFTTVFTGRSVLGWSGNNIQYFSYGTFGGYSNQTGNQYKYRITFRQTAINSNYGSASVSDIRFIGSSVWNGSSVEGVNWKLNKNDLYKWDRDFNVTFPAQVTATQFNGKMRVGGSGGCTMQFNSSTNALDFIFS